MNETITIVGAGIAGLALGFELTRRGRCVRISDSGSIGGGTSRVATSYLEPRFGRSAARRLEWESLRRWREFADAAGVQLGHGQWRHAWAEDEAAVRRDMVRRQDAGWSARWVDGNELRKRFPGISTEVTGAVGVAEPALVDAAEVCRMLASRILEAGNTIHEHTSVKRRDVEGTVVLANGYDASRWGNPALPRLRRLKGTTLRYRTTTVPPFVLRHSSVTIVPRPDGVVAGATKEPDAADLTPDPHVVAGLHARAVRVIPGLGEVEPEPVCGWRTYAADAALALGRSSDLWWSLGHGGVGYLRAPVVAQELAAAICGEPDPFVHCAPFFTDAASEPLGVTARPV